MMHLADLSTSKHHKVFVVTPNVVWWHTKRDILHRSGPHMRMQSILSLWENWGHQMVPRVCIDT